MCPVVSKEKITTNLQRSWILPRKNYNNLREDEPTSSAAW